MNIHQLLYDKYCYWFADKMILDTRKVKTKPHCVNLHYWDSVKVNGPEFKNNLGDDLSPKIVSYMLSLKGLSLDTTISGKRKHLYAVGSIIAMGYQNATIWGSGFLEGMSDEERKRHHNPRRHLDIRCVRGPLSGKILREMGYDCPEVYGDPALLMPRIYDIEHTDENDLLIIPHFRKEEEYRKSYGDKSIASMVTNDYRSVIDRICISKKVVSSSLHGIILAEAYGKPAIWLRDRGATKDFKYYDYYASTNRNDVIYASNIQEAINMQPMNLPINLETLRQGLTDAFPYDLWGLK